MAEIRSDVPRCWQSVAGTAGLAPPPINVVIARSVGCSKIAAIGSSSRPASRKAWLSFEISTVASSDVPPLSKKLSSRPTRGSPRTSFQSRTTLCPRGSPACSRREESAAFDAEPLPPTGLSVVPGMHDRYCVADFYASRPAGTSSASTTLSLATKGLKGEASGR